MWSLSSLIENSTVIWNIWQQSLTDYQPLCMVSVCVCALDPGGASAPPGSGCNRRKWIRRTAGCDSKVGLWKKKKERLVPLLSLNKDTPEIWKTDVWLVYKKRWRRKLKVHRISDLLILIKRLWHYGTNISYMLEKWHNDGVYSWTNWRF